MSSILLATLLISPVISCNALQTDPDSVEDTAEAGLIGCSELTVNAEDGEVFFSVM